MSQENIIMLAFGVLVLAGYLIRNWYIRQPKSYVVSEQVAGKFRLSITDHNPKQDDASLKMKFRVLSSFEGNAVPAVEFISKKSEFERFTFEELNLEHTLSKTSEADGSWDFIFEKRDFLKVIREKEIKLNHFRFVVLSNGIPLIKSHVFVFSSKFMLIIIERGKHN
ncbi:MAG: hypothetical protein FD155_2083 [Bacteroidetes bacterium]|nr:MAG: hypothetical protein FD155_2083 [Bacteroidota bacterium]